MSDSVTTPTTTKFNLMVITSMDSISTITSVLKGIAHDHDLEVHEAYSKCHVMRKTIRKGNRVIVRTLDKTFFLMSPTFIQILSRIIAEEEDLPQEERSVPFQVKRYHLNQHRDNVPEGCKGLRLTVPEYMSVAEATKGIEAVMEPLISFDVLPSDSYEITFPGYRRDLGTHSGAAMVLFKGQIDPEAIAVSRVFIHQTFWFFRVTRKIKTKGRMTTVENDVIEARFLLPRSKKTPPKAKQGGKRDKADRGRKVSKRVAEAVLDESDNESDEPATVVLPANVLEMMKLQPQPKASDVPGLAPSETAAAAE